jgi:hypothetical protein
MIIFTLRTLLRPKAFAGETPDWVFLRPLHPLVRSPAPEAPAQVRCNIHQVPIRSILPFGLEMPPTSPFFCHPPLGVRPALISFVFLECRNRLIFLGHLGSVSGSEGSATSFCMGGMSILISFPLCDGLEWLKILLTDSCSNPCPLGFITAAAYSAGKSYVQVSVSTGPLPRDYGFIYSPPYKITGRFNRSMYTLSPDDQGGQMDVRFPDGAQYTYGG